MHKSICSFLRLLPGSGLALYAASLAAAPAVLLETTRLVPLDGVPEGGFGRSAAIDGDVAVIAANAQSKSRGVDPPMPGAAYVFERDPSSGEWQQTAKLTSGRDGDLFGIDVAVDGGVIVVAAVHSRLTHVFEKRGGSWQQTAVLGGTPGQLGNGNSVAVANGIVAIGDEAPHGMGLYRRAGGGWVNIANYEQGFGFPDDEYFSPQVDISPSTAIHGSWGSHYDPPLPSTAFIYTPGAGGDWAQPSIASIPQPGGTSNPNGFSSEVMISGNTAVISDVLFMRNSTGEWVDMGRIEGAAALGDDETTIFGHSLPFRSAPSLYRRNSAGDWLVRAEFMTSDASFRGPTSFDDGRALFLSNSNFAYVFEIPEDLDRPDLQQDDFQDGDANGWLTTPGSLFAVASDGDMRFFSQSSVAGLAAALWQSTVTNDQAIQVDVTPRAFDGSDRWFGLVTRYADIDNYYYVTARSSGVIQLKRMLAGSFTTLESAALPVAIGTTHRIRLEAIGEHIRVLVDDRVVINVRDSSLSRGVPGLMTYKTRADFDNVVVNANPAYVAFADSFGGFYWNWHTERGEWTPVEVNGSRVYRQSDLSGDARLLRTGANAGLGTLGDQIVQADLRPTAFSGSDRWVGLIARYRDTNNFHYVTLRSSGSLQIRKLVDGSIQTLASVPFTVQTDVTYRVRFEAIGTRLRVYVNGTLQAETTDASLTRQMSSAGVAMYKAALDVDNFSVVQP